MEYVAGIDLGTTYTAAAIGVGERVEIFDLGSSSAAIPSVVLLRDDGTVLAGEAAEHRSVTEASRTAREFKRRLGDPTPFLLGGTPYGAEALTGHLLKHVLSKIADQQGGTAGRVLLTHPANYGEYKLGYLREAARLASVDSVEFVLEPVAAAVHYASERPLDTGELLAVYDFGGGTLDMTMVRATDAGFELTGTPEGMERFGGIDLDEAVFFHVRRNIGDAIDRIDPTDPNATAALAALRVACREAKEALSADTDTTIPVMLPTVHTEVRLTRAEFEDMLRPRLRETVTVLERVVGSAGATFEDVTRVLLVGGASRIPLVAEMIRAETGRPVAVDAKPKHVVALGAARIALRHGEAEPATMPAAPVRVPVAIEEEVEEKPPEAEEAAPVAIEEDAGAVPIPASGENGHVEPVIPTVEGPAGSLSAMSAPKRRIRWIAPLIGLVVVAAVILFAGGLLGNGDGETAASDITSEEQITDEPQGGEESVQAEEPVPAAEPVPGEPRTASVGLVYFTGFLGEADEPAWQWWSLFGEARPPEDVSSDFYPLLGPYSSRDPGVLDQHLAWVELTGADVLVVDWQGGPTDSAVFETLLGEAENRGLRVVPMIAPYDGLPYPGRTPGDFLAEIDQLVSRYGDQPAWLRSQRPSLWSDEPNRLVVLMSSPAFGEGQDDIPPDDWAELTDGARSLGVLTVALGIDPGLLEAGRFDGLAGGVRDDGFNWVAPVPEGAWFVPVVAPGMSTERIGRPDESRDRGAGAFYEEQWTALEGSPLPPDMVLVWSFNGWADGTQIEPASDTPPDPRYRAYSPLETTSYLDMTRELADRFIGPRQ